MADSQAGGKRREVQEQDVKTDQAAPCRRSSCPGHYRDGVVGMGTDSIAKGRAADSAFFAACSQRRAKLAHHDGPAGAGTCAVPRRRRSTNHAGRTKQASAWKGEAMSEHDISRGPATRLWILRPIDEGA